MHGVDHCPDQRRRVRGVAGSGSGNAGRDLAVRPCRGSGSAGNEASCSGGIAMGLLDRLFGRRRQQQYPPPAHQSGYGGGYGGDYGGHGHGGEVLPDQQAIERYRYLLRAAPPEQIEQAHAEAFEKLTVDQRQQVLAQLAAAVPAAERPRTDDPATLARVATRAEVRQPGTLERALGGYGPGYGAGYGQGGYGQGG